MTSTRRMSPDMTVTFAGTCFSEIGDEVAVDFDGEDGGAGIGERQRQRSRPGPISRNTSPGAGSTAATTCRAQPGARKC